MWHNVIDLGLNCGVFDSGARDTDACTVFDI